MKAIQIDQTGGIEVLHLKNLAIPEPRDNEALIQLKAIGVNFVDIYHRIGRYSVPLPYVPGLEGAGIVVAVGKNVAEINVGDRVAYANQTGGSYAEYATIQADRLIPLPDSISFEEGAAFPLQGMTAHALLNDFYTIKSGSTVLIHAAAGGVGLLLVQMAKKLGAIVIATVSTTQKADLVQAAGADYIINYKQQDFVEITQQITHKAGVDYIIDGVGKETFTKDLDAIRIRGHICLFGSASGPAELLAPNSLQAKSITVSASKLINHIQIRSELLSRANAILNALEKSWLKLKIDHVYPLEQAAHAQHLLEKRQTTGKVILTP